MRTLLLSAIVFSCALGCRNRVSPPVVPTTSTASESNTPTEPEPAPLTEIPTPREVATSGTEPGQHDFKTEQRGTVEDDEPSESTTPEPQWSTMKMVFLAPGGPRLADLRVTVGGIDLPTGLASAADELAAELEIDWNTPPMWEALLDKPLVQSGWLGNLVPTTEQRGQLIALYDIDGNRMVEAAEFRAFITRGIARVDHLRIGRERAPSRSSASDSLFGPLDDNADGELSDKELDNVRQSLLRYDFDGDQVVSLAEVQSASDMNTNMSMQGAPGILESAKLLAVDPEKLTSTLNAIFECYTFTDTIPREAFYRWSAARFDALDANSDGQISKSELSALLDEPAEWQLDLTYPNSQADDGAPVEIASSRLPPSSQWQANATSGRLAVVDCVVTVTARDDHDPRRRAYLMQLLESAAEDAQVRALFVSQLELKEGAFDLLDSEDQHRFENAWRWITAARDWHVTVNWSHLESPWFELVDTNGDQRLTAAELGDFPDAARKWDRDTNGALDLTEVPLAINLTIARDDRRNQFFSAGGLPAENRGINALPAPAWFLGMDYNSDGEVTRAEFFGEESDFAALDSNADGIVDRREAEASSKAAER